MIAYLASKVIYPHMWWVDEYSGTHWKTHETSTV